MWHQRTIIKSALLIFAITSHAQFVPVSLLNKTRPPNLSGGRTDADCVAAGGTMVTVPGPLRICKFIRATCPSPWVAAASPNWTQTNSNTCTATCGTCSSGGHNFDAQAVESCMYNAYPILGCAVSLPTSCDATVTQVGCK